MLRSIARVAQRYVRPQIATRYSRGIMPVAISRHHFETVRALTSDDKSATLKMDAPQLMIAFTCKKCDTRSSHTFSKQAYNKGSVLIQCPGCKGRHLIADNLNMFRDNKVNLEDLLKAQGESVATTTDDLAFEDIPESLRGTLGHYAKDAPEEYKEKESGPRLLSESEKK